MQQGFTLCCSAKVNNIEAFIGSGSILDLHLLQVKTVVNCANKDMEHAGGLAADIAYRAGQVLIDECKSHISRHGSLRKKEVFVSTAGNMNFSKILHIAGPIVSHLTREHMEELTGCVENCIQAADVLGLDSIGIPGISCGIFGFPKKEAAICHIKGFIKYAKANPNSSVKKVYFSLFSPDELESFVDQFRILMDNFEFDQAKYIGVPKNRVNCFKIACGGCGCMLLRKDFLINRCHKKYCNYCVFRYKLGHCLICKKSQEADFDYPNNKVYTLFYDKKVFSCRICDKVKESSGKGCKNCNNICEDHFENDSDPCPYCKKVRS